MKKIRVQSTKLSISISPVHVDGSPRGLRSQETHYDNITIKPHRWL